MLHLTGEKQGMSEFNFIWKVPLTGDHEVVSSSSRDARLVYILLLKVFHCFFFNQDILS